MNYQDIILLVILLVGAAFINWSTLSRDLFCLFGKRRPQPPPTKTANKPPSYQREEYEEAA